MKKSELGKNIYLDRYSLGLSQADISRAIKISQQAIARWENGHSVPRHAVLQKLKDFFAQEFKKTGGESIVCSMVEEFNSMPKEKKPTVELRDYFAARAMQGAISGCSTRGEVVMYSDLAGLSYEVADAMMKARDDRRGN